MGATKGRYTDHVCVDIHYYGEKGFPIHSDLCYDKEHRKVLHDALDEWINKADGTGHFRLWREDTIIGQFEFDEDIHS